jgi:hypothetical protein
MRQNTNTQMCVVLPARTCYHCYTCAGVRFGFARYTGRERGFYVREIWVIQFAVVVAAVSSMCWIEASRSATPAVRSAVLHR